MTGCPELNLFSVLQASYLFTLTLHKIPLPTFCRLCGNKASLKF